MRILIAVPTYETIYPDTFKSIYDLDETYESKFDPVMPNEYIFEFVRGYDVATARNNIVMKAQELKADYILMVDNDTVLPKDALSNLLEHDQDVILGFYAHRDKKIGYDGKVNCCKLGEFNYTWQYTVDEMRELRENGEYLVQIHGGGMGCALIRTSVFDRIRYPWYDWVNYDDDARGLLSEDLYFCEQCKWQNIPIYMDTRVGCGHIFRTIQEVM